MASSLQEIQGILRALAEESGTRLPRKTPNRNMPKPKEDAYDMRQTVKYIVKTLLPNDIMQRAAEHIQACWNQNVRLDGFRNDSRSLDFDLSDEGQKWLFSWDVLDTKFREDNTEMSEYGYDSNGHLCLLVVHGRVELPDDANPFDMTPPDAYKTLVAEHMVTKALSSFDRLSDIESLLMITTYDVQYLT